MKKNYFFQAASLIIICFLTLYTYAAPRVWHEHQAAASCQAGAYDVAQKTYQKLLRENKEDASLHYNQGVTYYKQGAYAQAEESFARAAALSTDDEYTKQAYFNLANSLAFQQTKEKLTAAIDAYDAALAIDPDNTKAQENREIVKKLLEHMEQQEQNDQQDNQDQDSSESQNNDEQEGSQDNDGHTSDQEKQQGDTGKDEQRDQADEQERRGEQQGGSEKQQAEHDNDSGKKKQGNNASKSEDGQQGVKSQEGNNDRDQLRKDDEGDAHQQDTQQNGTGNSDDPLDNQDEQQQADDQGQHEQPHQTGEQEKLCDQSTLNGEPVQPQSVDPYEQFSQDVRALLQAAEQNDEKDGRAMMMYQLSKDVSVNRGKKNW